MGCGRSVDGAIAQLGERLLCTQEVSGSIPLGSTITSTSLESTEMNAFLGERIDFWSLRQ
jgi:hypothetical protein